MLRLLFVRHGQTEWNREPRFRGRADVALDATGMVQARRLGKRLAGEGISKVYVSPLRRALATATVISESHGLRPRMEDGLIDIDYGKWEGLIPQEVSVRWPDLLNLWHTAPHRVAFPEGESLADVAVRVREFLRRLVADSDEATVCSVAHKVVNKMVLCEMLGLDGAHFWEFEQTTGCVNSAVYNGGAWAIEKINDTCHLKDPGSDLAAYV